MQDVRVLTADEVSAVNGGATGNGGGLPGPHPQPSPVEVIVGWILHALGAR